MIADSAVFSDINNVNGWWDAISLWANTGSSVPYANFNDWLHNSSSPVAVAQRPPQAGEAPHASSPASIAPHASSPAGVAPHTSSTSPAGLNGGQRDTKEIEVVRDVLGDVNVALVESVWLIVAVMGSGPQFPPQAGLITTVAGLYPWSHYLLLSVGDCFLD